MKYLHLLPSLAPESGGPAEGVKQLSAAALRLGHSVEVVTLDPPGAGYLADFPGTVHALGPSMLGKYRYAPGLVPWLRRHAPDYSAVIVNGLWQYPGLACWRALHDTATPYFVFTHGMLDPWFRRHYPLKHAKKWLYWPWAEYRVLRDARAVLFTCERERMLARESFSLYSARESVVSYGTPGPGGDPDRQLALFYERFAHLRGKRILLFLGRLHEKKGCDLLLEAFGRCAAAHPDVHLMIAGPGSGGLVSELQRRQQTLGVSNVDWPGMLSGNLKWGALRAAEAFVLPSHQENFGIAVAEALACGTPVLISDKVNIFEEILADGAGLVDEDTLEGTTRLVRRWLGLASELREEMRDRALQCFLLRFHIDSAARTLLNTLSRWSSDELPATLGGARP